MLESAHMLNLILFDISANIPEDGSATTASASAFATERMSFCKVASSASYSRVRSSVTALTYADEHSILSLAKENIPNARTVLTHTHKVTDNALNSGLHRRENLIQCCRSATQLLVQALSIPIKGRRRDAQASGLQGRELSKKVSVTRLWGICKRVSEGHVLLSLN
jgi:hypothetical protein